MVQRLTRRRPEAIAFDLDGTLVDSAPDIAFALNTALHGRGLPLVDAAGVREWIGDGPDVLIERALGALGTAPALHAAALRRAFDAAAFDAPLQHGAVFDGIVPLLCSLHADWPMVVVTNKPTALARALLDAAGLSAFFVAVHGADRAALRKPAPDMLVQAAQGLGVDGNALCMVGDSAADAGAAFHAGAPAVRADWGYGGAQRWRWPVLHRIARPQQLFDWLRAGA
jgi:phosphoglycolate phosphatase